ncbi:MAG: YdbH domain-containing protein [Cognaticolwellia sp.]
MTFPKKTLFALALTMAITIAIIISAYMARIPLIAHVIKAELAEYQANVSCLDFHLTSDFNLAISRLCLQVPQADILIADMLIIWQASAKQIVTDIDITSATIKGTASLFNQPTDSAKQSKQENIIAQLKSYTRLLADVELPNITLNELHYLPFNAAHKNTTLIAELTETPHYLARLAVNNNHIDFALSQQAQPQSPFLTTTLERSQASSQQFTIDISGQLQPLQALLLSHNLPLPTFITNTLANAKTQGKLAATVVYSNDILTLNSRLQNFSFASSEGIEASGPFALSGELHAESKLNLTEQYHTDNNTQLELQFQQASQLTLDYSQQHLMAYLANKDLPAMLITALNDNPISQLTLKPKGKLTYQLKNQHLSVAGIDLTAKSSEQAHRLIHQQNHQLSVNNIAVDLNSYLSNKAKKISEDDNKKILAQLDYKLASPIVLSAINKVTQKPILLNLHGSMSQTRTQDLNNTQGKTVTTITFAQGSVVSGHNIALLKSQKTIKASHKKKATTQKLVSVKQLTTALRGKIQFIETAQDSMQDAGQQVAQKKGHLANQSKAIVKLNLTTQTLAKKLNAANMVEIKNLAFNAEVSGDLDNITLNANASADNVPLGHLAVSGAITQPDISANAEKLPLTDLLSLNIKLPVAVALVDGDLSYNVSGQITDLANIENTPFAISVNVASLSGDIEKIWIQELNWQQNFDYLAGKLTTGKNSKENLTVALIDTATPISKLAIRTAFSYQQEFKISAENLSANVLGGSFAIPKIQWPISNEHSVDVQLNRIDLEQVLALDKKQGIVVTGDISGHLPVRFDGEKFTMAQGELHNVSNGLIQVKDNPAVEELKANNSQLKLAFDALQNLHYHQLSSDVSMADDGYMLLETVIKGRNPDIDNDVNLNLNLSYDLLGLLESLSITEQFEKSIIKGLQKK